MVSVDAQQVADLAIGAPSCCMRSGASRRSCQAVVAPVLSHLGGAGRVNDHDQLLL